MVALIFRLGFFEYSCSDRATKPAIQVSIAAFSLAPYFSTPTTNCTLRSHVENASFFLAFALVVSNVASSAMTTVRTLDVPIIAAVYRNDSRLPRHQEIPARQR